LNEQGLEISAFVHSTVRFVVIMAFIVNDKFTNDKNNEFNNIHFNNMSLPYSRLPPPPPCEPLKPAVRTEALERTDRYLKTTSHRLTIG